MNKKAMSQVISTILLITLVIFIAGMIIFWSKGIIGESITIHGQNIALVCNDLFFEFSYNYGTLYLVNSGNVDIYSMTLVMHTEDNSEVKNINELSSNWPKEGLEVGGVFSDTISFNADVKEVSLIPVLRGDTESGKQKVHICEYEEQIIEVK